MPLKSRSTSRTSIPQVVVASAFMSMYIPTVYRHMTKNIDGISDLSRDKASLYILAKFVTANIFGIINGMSLPLRVLLVSHETWNKPPEKKPITTRVMDFVRKVYQ